MVRLVLKGPIKHWVVHTEVRGWVFTLLRGELIHEAQVDNVDAGVRTDLLQGNLIASLPPIHSNVRVGRSIEGRCDSGQEAKSDGLSKHD